jgi:hypothetical protein
MIKAVIKKTLYRFFPRTATALFSARDRAHSHRVIAGWGCPAINEALIARYGSRVLGGPFAGMTLTPATRKEQLGPCLLGLYESELHPVWKQVFAGSYPQVIDVGAKFGYYAVGLARRFPGSRVFAFDTDHWARRALREMIAANDVSNVEVLRYCDPGWLTRNLAPGALIVCDCEGYEGTLFGTRPIAHLATATLVVETHDTMVPGTTERLRAALAATHRLEEISTEASLRACPVDIGFLDERQRELATKEVRPPQWFLHGVPKAGPRKA